MGSSNNEEVEAFLCAISTSCSHIINRVIEAATQLKLFDIISRAKSSNACMSSSEIASKIPTRNPDAPCVLDRMLRLLASHSLLTCTLRTRDDGTQERCYGMTPAGTYLVTKETEGSIVPFLSFNSSKAMNEVWLLLKDAVLEGSDLFKKVHGKALYEYMNTDSKLNNIFNESMANLSTRIMKFVLETYKGFEGTKVLVDIAGGIGTSLNMIISNYPSVKGINFDLPHVIEHAPSFPGIKHIGGDMFKSVPKGDAIMLKHICHNWSDKKCIEILKKCHEALPQNGKLIVIDHIMPLTSDSSFASKLASAMDNMMLIFPDGKERTEKEFEAVFKSSGFSKFHFSYAYPTLGIIEVYK